MKKTEIFEIFLWERNAIKHRSVNFILESSKYFARENLYEKLPLSFCFSVNICGLDLFFYCWATFKTKNENLVNLLQLLLTDKVRVFISQRGSDIQMAIAKVIWILKACVVLFLPWLRW